MRRVAAAFAGAAALAVMTPSLPWQRMGCTPQDCSFSEEWISPPWLVVGLIAYLAIPSVVLVLILVGLLAIKDRRGAADGRPPVTLRAAAAQGLRDGAVTVGAAYAMAAVVHVGINVLNGWPPIDDVGQPWLTRLVEAGIIIGCLVLAHTVRASIAYRPASPRATSS